jgi:hypothetical protein
LADAAKTRDAAASRTAGGRTAPSCAANDPVDHPAHYTSHPSGIECITVVEHMPFNIGNAVKYLWRAGLKGATIVDLEKAAWYVRREIQRLEKSSRA